jgi:hypothetical protein
MKYTVKYYTTSVVETMRVVNELRGTLKQHIDFEFAWHSTKWCDVSFAVIDEGHVVFSFATEELATYFTLKYL